MTPGDLKALREWARERVETRCEAAQIDVAESVLRWAAAAVAAAAAGDTDAMDDALRGFKRALEASREIDELRAQSLAEIDAVPDLTSA